MSFKTKNVLNPKLRFLLPIGGVAGLVAVFIFRRNLAAEFFILHQSSALKNILESMPASITDWFNIFLSNWFIGFILSNFFDLINSLLVLILMSCLYLILKNKAHIFMTISLILSIISSLFYFCSNVSFRLLSLSRQYSNAISEEDKLKIIKMAGRFFSVGNPADIKHSLFSMLALFFLLVSGISASIAMKKSEEFTRKTVIIGFIAHISGLVFFILFPINPVSGAIPLSFSAPFIIIWYFIISRKLFQITKEMKI